MDKTKPNYLKFNHYQNLGKQENEMPSFDAVCEPNVVELKNAIEQANKEISNRFDFKGSDARV